MSEADLQRLAQILQERGEGLAAINSGEAQLLKAFGGAGEALPGTSGMGPGGGPIRSYRGQGATTVESSTERSDSQSGWSDDGQTYTYSESEQAVVDAAIEASQQSGDGDSNNNQPPPPPPPKYYDTLGNEYSTQEARDAANEAIKVEREVLATKFTDLKTDSSFDYMQQQGEIPTFTYLPESEVKAEFDKKMGVAAEEGRTEVPRLAELLNKYLNTTDPNTCE